MTVSAVTGIADGIQNRGTASKLQAVKKTNQHYFMTVHRKVKLTESYHIAEETELSKIEIALLDLSSALKARNSNRASVADGKCDHANA